jgi:hypothetical protein
VCIVSCCRHRLLPTPTLRMNYAMKSIAIIPKIYGCTLKYSINYLIMKAPRHTHTHISERDRPMSQLIDIAFCTPLVFESDLIRFDDVHENAQTNNLIWLTCVLNIKCRACERLIASYRFKVHNSGCKCTFGCYKY